jgi:1-acyl-sn-glycerol-3-phosphate acyltransferase
MRTGFVFYFKSFRVEGAENIPKKKAILFVSNHQNALIDPLVIGSISPRVLHYLTRAGVFSGKIVKSILYSINMLPIYRISDGINSLSKNEQVFQKCYDVFNEGGTVLIFAEGSHNLRRKVRVLSKGFTRIVYGALDKYPDLDIDIIPIGVNYSDATKYASNVSIYFGSPIAVKPYWNQIDKNDSVNQLKQEVREQLKKVTTHIEDNDRHDEIVKLFNKDEFLFPEKVNKKLEDIDSLKPVEIEKENDFNLLTPFVKFNSFFPLLIWKKVSPKIKEDEFISTFRFSVGVTAFPIIYIIQALLLSFFFGGKIGMIYLFLSFLSVYLLTKSK